jgi:hypothetical protein
MAGNALAAPFFIPGTPTVGLTTAIPSPAAAVTIFAAGSIVNCADISNPPTASTATRLGMRTSRRRRT